MLGRDPFGIKQLYYAIEPDGVLFASEPQAIVAARNVSASNQPADMRPKAAFELLQLQFTTGADTIFSGIHRLLPGEVVAIEDGAIVERRVGPAVLPEAVRRRPDRQALSEIDRVIDDTVVLHQRSDVPYGLFLSSGIDSATILSAMQRLNAEPVRTYTAAFPETGVYDERDVAAAMAAAAGARHVEVAITAAEFFARLPEMAAALDDPVADYAIVPMFLLAERAAEDVKVVLSGIGGDEVFAGYRRYRRQMLPRWLGGRPRRRKGPCDTLDLFAAAAHRLAGRHCGRGSRRDAASLQRAAARPIRRFRRLAAALGPGRARPLPHALRSRRAHAAARSRRRRLRLQPAQPAEASLRPGQVSDAAVARRSQRRRHSVREETRLHGAGRRMDRAGR